MTDPKFWAEQMWLADAPANRVRVATADGLVTAVDRDAAPAPTDSGCRA